MNVHQQKGGYRQTRAFSSLSDDSSSDEDGGSVATKRVRFQDRASEADDVIVVSSDEETQEGQFTDQASAAMDVVVVSSDDESDTIDTRPDRRDSSDGGHSSTDDSGPEEESDEDGYRPGRGIFNISEDAFETMMISDANLLPRLKEVINSNVLQRAYLKAKAQNEHLPERKWDQSIAAMRGDNGDAPSDQQMDRVVTAYFNILPTVSESYAAHAAAVSVALEMVMLEKLGRPATFVLLR